MGLGWPRVVGMLCVAASCSTPDAPPSRPTPSATASTQPDVSASAVTPTAPSQPSAPPLHAAPLRGFPQGTSATAIGEALRSVGWKPIGNRSGSVKGVDVTTVLASRSGKTAEVKVFEGHPEGLRDMLELKGTAQGFAEMTMLTVLVKGDAAETDRLYEQLMGSPPERHGSGLGGGG